MHACRRSTYQRSPPWRDRVQTGAHHVDANATMWVQRTLSHRQDGQPPPVHDVWTMERVFPCTDPATWYGVMDEHVSSVDACVNPLKHCDSVTQTPSQSPHEMNKLLCVYTSCRHQGESKATYHAHRETPEHQDDRNGHQSHPHTQQHGPAEECCNRYGKTISKHKHGDVDINSVGMRTRMKLHRARLSLYAAQRTATRREGLVYKGLQP